jgi:hypothetical protein
VDAITLALSVALPWLLGIAVLAALDWPGGETRGYAAAMRAGFGYVVGMILLTLWMRALSAAGIGFGRMSIGLPLFAAVVLLSAWATRNRRLSVADFRHAITALARPSLEGWQRVAWIALVAWLIVHFALMAAEIAWRPLYPWDAWVQWATKARVWYELGHMAPFVRAAQWLAGTGGAYFDASPDYPATVPLMQVWTCVALGRWDDSAMNWPWLAILISLTFAMYGSLRAEGVAPLTSLFGAYFLATLPLVDVHVALAGYADLPMGAVYGLAAIAFYRWSVHRRKSDAMLALFLAIACPMIKNPGWIWALTIVPGVIVAFAPRRGLRIVVTGFAVAVLGVLAIARTQPTLLGYHLKLDFAPAWAQLVKSYYLMGNWNLLWYAVIALMIFGWRRLSQPPLLPLSAVVAAGLIFLAIVFSFTTAAEWIADLTTANRASMHLAPLLVFAGVLLWHRMTLAAPEEASVTPSAPVPDAP